MYNDILSRDLERNGMFRIFFFDGLLGDWLTASIRAVAERAVAECAACTTFVRTEAMMIGTDEIDEGKLRRCWDTRS